MDDTNKDILKLLRDNGRMSFTEIGERLGLSRVAVKKKVAKVKEAGIIRGYKAVIYREGSVKMFIEITTVKTNNSDYCYKCFRDDKYGAGTNCADKLHLYRIVC